MRRYALVLGERERLRAEIRSHIAGNLHNGKPVGELHAALEALDDGAEETQTAHAVYRVTHDPHPAPVTTTAHCEGTRAELVAELKQTRDDRAVQGRPEKVTQLNEAIEELDGPLQAACASALGVVYLVAQTGD